MNSCFPFPKACASHYLKCLAAWLACCAGLWAADETSKTPPPLPDADHAAKMSKGLDLFKQHVKPLLVARCLKCHGGKTTEGELDLVDRTGLLRGGAAGPAILVGNSKESLLYRLVTHGKEPHMPHKASKLALEEIAHLAAWIDNGAPYDKPLIEGKSSTPLWIQKTLPDEARNFWSLRPLQRSEPPSVKNVGWCRQPLDRFILAKLEAAGIQPNPEVEKRQWIRRVYFDVIGLPPTPEEVKSFLDDSSADAYEKLVDRLLASPRHGERWARHWLDLVRFAESHGFEHDSDRPSAFHYRDFVIKAFNDDLPYDTFVKWQLAGDEVEPENNQALTATGFLAAGVHSTQITKKEVEKQRYDELDDITATLGTSMLGLTIGCARCHDHKFDPIPQRDYYRILSTFTTTVRSEIDFNSNPEGYRKEKSAFDLEHAPFVAALQRYETEQLPGRLAAWETSRVSDKKQPVWVTLEPTSFKSEGGATFTKLADGSLRASGKNSKFDTYTIAALTDIKGITAVKLEALTDPALVKGGPGRASNGNFALSDFRVAQAPKTGGQANNAGLRNPQATFEQAGFPIRATIDNDEHSGWAVDPQFGKDHAAIFETETPIGHEGGTLLTFTLKFKNNDGHNLGRIRFSVTAARPPFDFASASIPEKIVPILALPRDKRSAAQQAELTKWYSLLDPEWSVLDKKVQDHLARIPKPTLVKELIATEGLPALRLHSQGVDFFDKSYFLRRGDPDQKDGVATLGYLQALTPLADQEKLWPAQPPKGARTSHRRLALANWLTDVDRGAGRLLARVIVNRLWQHHMGIGIVATPSDFGTRGAAPTHPELLDWLASELIRNGWKLKPIHKLILTSSTYRLNTRSDAAKSKVDQENKLIWRRPHRRLEAETIRDALLAISGTLDERMYGPGALDEGSKRRSIYFTVKRSKLIPMMQVFDAPEALGGVAERPTTTIAPQALLLMNNPQVRNFAKALARRSAPDAKTALDVVVQSAYVRTLSRPPNADEMADSLAFLKQQIESYQATGNAEARNMAIADYCQTLMCLNEFVYVE